MVTVFRKLDGSWSSVRDDNDQILTFESAELLATTEASRDVTITPELISYIRYSNEFDDFCRVKIRFAEPDRGIYGIDLLPLTERNATELLDDQKILLVKRRERGINAVRLYRHLHGGSLRDAIDGLARLEATEVHQR
jgi:hypothetical protein